MVVITPWVQMSQLLPETGLLPVTTKISSNSFYNSSFTGHVFAMFYAKTTCKMQSLYSIVYHDAPYCVQSSIMHSFDDVVTLRLSSVT